MGKESINTLVRFSIHVSAATHLGMCSCVHTAQLPAQTELSVLRSSSRAHCDWVFAHSDVKSIHGGLNVFTEEK